MSVFTVQSWALERFFAKWREDREAKIDHVHERITGTHDDLLGKWQDLRDHPREDARFARGRPVASRKWSGITGFCLHQTATEHLTPGHPLLPAIPAHALVHRDGSITLLHYATAYVQHGGRLNRRTIGIEFVCRAAGIEGAPGTFWRSRKERANGRSYDDLVAEATVEQMDAGIWLMRWYRDQKRAQHGGDIPDIWAHRQSDASRTSDPGERIWRGVALKAERAGIATTRPKDKVWNGNRIPHIWGGAEGVKYR